MFKLAGRHEWEASTKGKRNIQPTCVMCGRRGRCEGRPRPARNAQGVARMRAEESPVIDKEAPATAILRGAGSRTANAEGGGRGLQDLLSSFVSINRFRLSRSSTYRRIVVFQSIEFSGGRLCETLARRSRSEFFPSTRVFRKARDSSSPN